MQTHGAYLNRAGAAAFYGVSVRTIDRWVGQGVLRSVRIGGVRRFRRADLDESPRNGPVGRL